MTDDFDDDSELEAKFGIGTKASPATKPALNLVVSHAKAIYHPFVTKNLARGFEIISSDYEDSFSYPQLLAVRLHRPRADYFFLLTSSALIEVWGRNLRPITNALNSHNCETITQFLPDEHEPPTDKTAPFIERIEVLMSRPPEKKERGAQREITPEDA